MYRLSEHLDRRKSPDGGTKKACKISLYAGPSLFCKSQIGLVRKFWGYCFRAKHLEEKAIRTAILVSILVTTLRNQVRRQDLCLNLPVFRLAMQLYPLCFASCDSLAIPLKEFSDAQLVKPAVPLRYTVWSRQRPI